jgi:hypothetical protein
MGHAPPVPVFERIHTSRILRATTCLVQWCIQKYVYHSSLSSYTLEICVTFSNFIFVGQVPCVFWNVPVGKTSTVCDSSQAPQTGSRLFRLISGVRLGRAIAQGVSRRLLKLRPVFEPRSCGICGGQSDIGAGLLRVLRFPLPVLISPTAPHSSSYTIRGWYNRPISGRRSKWAQSHPPTPPPKLKKLGVGLPCLEGISRVSLYDVNTNKFHSIQSLNRRVVSHMP